MASSEGNDMHILEEIVDACHAQKNWSARMLEELARLSEERDGVITQFSLEQLAAPPLPGVGPLEDDVEQRKGTPDPPVGADAVPAPSGESGAASGPPPPSSPSSVPPEHAVIQHFLGRVQAWRQRAGPLGAGLSAGEEKSGLESGEDEDDIASAQERLAQLQLDPRLFRSMLLSIKSFPALYRAVLSHPLISGRASSKSSSSSSSGRSSKSSRKKRRDKDKEKDKDKEGGGEGGEGSSRADSAALFSLGAMQQAEPLPEPLLGQQAACLTARAVADRSLQAMLIVVKVLLDAYVTSQEPSFGDGSASFGQQVPTSSASGKRFPTLSVGAILSLLFPPGDANPCQGARSKAVVSIEKARAKAAKARAKRLAASMKEKKAAALGTGSEVESAPKEPGARSVSTLSGLDREVDAAVMDEGGDDEEAAMLEEALAMSIAMSAASSSSAGEEQQVTTPTAPRTTAGKAEDEEEAGADDVAEMDIDPKQGEAEAMEQAEPEEDEEEEDEEEEDEEEEDAAGGAMADDSVESVWQASLLGGQAEVVDLNKPAQAIRASYFPRLRGEQVPVDVVILSLLNHLDDECAAYRARVLRLDAGDQMAEKPRSSAAGPALPAPSSCIQPHPLTFMLLHTLMTDILGLLRCLEEQEDERSANPVFSEGGPSISDPALEMDDFEIEDISAAAATVSSPMTKKLRLPTPGSTSSGSSNNKGGDSVKTRLRFFAGCAAVSTLRVLNANLLYVARMGLGGSVGLGQVTAPPTLGPSLSKRKTSLTSSSGGSSQSLATAAQQASSGSGAASSSASSAPSLGEVKGSSSSSNLLASLAEPATPPPPMLFVVRLRRTLEQLMDLQDRGGFYAAEVGVGPPVRSEAMSAWCTGLEFFYPLHAHRQAILLDLLTHQPSRPREKQPEVREAQREALLELLCLRMAQPDLRQHFFEPKATASSSSAVPTTPGLDAESKEEEEGGPDLASELDPSLLLGGEEGQQQQTGGLSSFLILSRGATSSEATEGHGQLPLVVELLLEQLQDPWAAAKSKEGTFRAKLTLLHALQQRLVEVLTSRTSRGADMQQVEFDPKRASEHITLSNNCRTATQRGSKTWGSVIGSTGFAPNTGVHQWMVRLDRCEKGHVFIGVCTAEASTRTYVGGDRHGWGMIGTKALWHNRSKVRGDYGEGYGSRCMVRVRLDTDKGTLSMGIGASDWGVAFEKFPRSEALYPAVGLYQRDDQVTLLPVTADARIRRPLPATQQAQDVREVLVPVMEYTLRLARAANHVLDALDEADRDRRSLCARHPILQRLLPSLGAALCLLPPMNSGSSQLVTKLIPPLTALVKRLDRLFSRMSLSRERPAPSEIDGTWVLRSGAAENIPAQEYRLTLRTKPPDSSHEDRFGAGGAGERSSSFPSLRVVEGEGEGGVSKVAVEGAMVGSRLRFFETWRQGGTCMVVSRLSLDGGSFWGTFRDTRSSTSGSIWGRKVRDASESEDERAMERLGRVEAVLSLLAGKLCCLLMIGVDDGPPSEAHHGGEGSGEEVLDVQDDEDEDDEEVDQSGTAAAVAGDMDDGTGAGAATSLMEADDPMGSAAAQTAAARQEELDEKEAMLKLLAKWRCSKLLSGGLPLPDTIEHLQASKPSLQQQHHPALPHDMGGQQAASSSSSSAAEDWWRSVVLKLPVAEGGGFQTAWFGGGDVGGSTELYDDLMAGRGLAMEVDKWVQRHVGESPFTRVGGEPMKVARRAVLAALLRHSGASQRVVPEWESKGVSNARPGELMIQVWKAAQRVVNWAVRNKQTTGLSFAAMADMMEHKARFLMAVLPSPAASAIAQELGSIAVHTPAELLDRSLLAASPLTTGPLEVEERCVELVSEVVSFFESPLRDMDALRKEMMRASMLAFDRAAGLRAVHLLIGSAPRDPTAVPAMGLGPIPESPPGTDRPLLLSQAVSSALQYVSPALLGHVDPFSLNEGISSSIAALYSGGSLTGKGSPSSSSSSSSSSPPGGHYLDGLEGCCLHLRQSVRQAFERLFTQLAQLLQRAVAALDLDTTLVVLQAWGLVIQPEDHDFLARVGIFRALQSVLDGVRPDSDHHPSHHHHQQQPPTDSIADRLMLQSRHRVVRAALKVVHLLATQVASSSEDWGQPCVPTPKADVLLTRQVSGPATLGKSLFDMLYSELLGALRMAAAEAEGRSGGVAGGPVIPPSLSSDLSAAISPGGAMGGRRGDESEDTELSSNQYCYRIIGLLHSVSSSPVCKRDLTSPKWLRLLLAGVQTGNPSTQRRIFRLLRQLLPSLDPEKLRTRLLPTLDLLDGMEDDVEASGLSAADDAMDEAGSTGPSKPSGSLVDFILQAIGSCLPDSLVREEEEADEAPATASSSTTTDILPSLPRRRKAGSSRFNYNKFASEGVQLTSEAVALARCLLEVPAWAKVLNASFLASLHDLPAVLGHVGRSSEDWAEKRGPVCRAIATLGVLGGYLEDLRVGGLVSLRPFSIYGMSDTLALRLASMTHTCGILIDYEPEKRTAEVVLVEREPSDTSKPGGMAAGPSKAGLASQSSSNHGDKGGSSGSSSSSSGSASLSLGRGLSLAGGLPIRSVKLSTEDLVPISEVEPFLPAVAPAVAAALFLGMMQQGVKWIDDSDPANDDHDEEEEQKGGDDEEEGGRMAWDLKVIESSVALKTFRAAAALLSSPALSSTFIRNPRVWRTLLRVAGRPMSRCGLTGVKALQEAWIDLWQQWKDSFTPKPKASPPAPADGQAPPPPPPSSGAGGGGGGGEAATSLSIRGLASTASATAAAQSAALQQSSGASTEAGGAAPPPLPPRPPEPSSAEQAAAVATMMEMGFPKELCEVALRRCGNNIEVAVNFCFEHGGDLEQIMAEEQAIQAAAAVVAARGARNAESMRRSLESTILMKQLLEMGFPQSWCAKALAANHNNVNAALTWILSNGEALAAEEEAAGEGGQGGEAAGKQGGAEEEEKAEPEEPAVEGPNPLRIVSGAAEIGANLSVEGVARGGFASVGCRGCLVRSGKWYYEATLRTAGCMQIGWCDAGFRGDAQSGDGVGDGPTSWAYDGWRQFKWHDGHSEWGARWKAGDVVGCAVDLDEGTMSFMLNGRAEEVGMGVAYTHLSYSGGLYPCASFNRREKMLFNFGASPLKHGPPPGYRPYIEAVTDAMAHFRVLRDRFRLKEEDKEEEQGEEEEEEEEEEKGEGPEAMAVSSPEDDQEGGGGDDHEGAKAEERLSAAAQEAMYVDDRMEEEAGTETLRWQHRYFTPDSLSRGAGGLGGGQRGLSAGRRAEGGSGGGGGGPLSLEGTAALSRKLTEVARELCVLYARRAVLTILATWPALDDTSKTLDSLLLLPDHNHDEQQEEVPPASSEAWSRPLPIVDLLKVVSVVGPDTQAHLSRMSLVTSDAVFANYLESAIHAGGAPCLHAIMPAMSEAVALALREGRRPIVDNLCRSVVQQVYAALEQQEVSVTVITGGPSGDERWSDEDARRHPNLSLAVWLTGLLLGNRGEAASADLAHAVLELAMEAWALAFKSPSVQLKQVACSMVSAILQEAGFQACTMATPPSLPALLAHLDTPRLEALALRRMWAERHSHPVVSRYAQGLVDLCASISLAKQVLPPPPPQTEPALLVVPDASMPQAPPVRPSTAEPALVHRDWEEGLVASDQGWELWSGSVTQHAIEWKRPDKLTPRSLLEGGEGPPCLLPGHKVVRGINWRADDEDGGEGAVGTVEEVVEWEGKAGQGRRVRWPNGTVAVYRWGAMGQFDLLHVEVGRDGSIVKRYPSPETAESVATRGGFGLEQHFGLLLWIKPPPPGTPRLPTDPSQPVPIEGVCEWPDQAASSWVTGERHVDGSITFSEVKLLSGAVSMGWVGRYGQTEWRPGVTYQLSPTLDSAGEDSSSTKLLGHYSFRVTLAGQELTVSGDVRLQQDELFGFDRHFKSDGVGISEDGRSAFCMSSECKSLAYGSVGFSQGVHYWEVKIEQEEVGSIYLGVAEKPEPAPVALGPGNRPTREPARLNRWQGWGFINYRASFSWNPGEGGGGGGGHLSSGSPPERAYGDNFHFGDLVGVKLDMDKGVLSFFLDGMKYGEHLLSDLGVAFDNLLPSRPHVRPRVLFPVVGFRKKGDRVTLTGRWLSTPGAHPSTVLADAKAVSSLLQAWELNALQPHKDWLPQWLYREAWSDWRRWRTGRWRRVLTRAQSGVHIDVDTSVDACVRASLLMGLKKPLLAGDRVRVTRRCGKVLEQPEARVVLGAYRGMLWYQIDSQREAGGGDRGANMAWCWLACDADGLETVSQALRVRGSEDVELDMLPAFQGGKLRVVYDQAVVREGLEIDTSDKVGEVDHGSILTAEERRLNSSNIARYRIRHNGMVGWISERIRGESEDLIVVRIPTDASPAGARAGGGESSAEVVGPSSTATSTSAAPSQRPEERVQEAVLKWKRQVLQAASQAMDTDDAVTPADVSRVWCLESADEGDSPPDLSFQAFVRLSGAMRDHDEQQQQQGSGWSVEADMQLAELLSHASESLGDAPFKLTFKSLRSALQRELSEEEEGEEQPTGLIPVGSLLANSTPDRLLARASLLRVLNDRLSRSLPFLSLSLPEADWEREQVGYTELVEVEPSYDDPLQAFVAKHPTNASSLVASHSRLWKPMCTARRLRALRRLALTSTKRALWDSVLMASTTATPLHQDEYEDPREIKTIKINRVRASASRLAAVRNINERLRLSVFGQLHKEMRSWPPSTFRRAYLGKGHGGQRRAFKVKFLGEGVNDYGGPYRAVFEQIVDELQDDRFPLSQRPGEKCLLPLLVPCPNRMGAVGSNQDKFVLNPGPSSPLALELMQFLGKMVGMAVRHGLPMGLDLPATVWRPLVGQTVHRSHLESYDLLAVRTLQQVESTGLAAEALACTPRGADRSLVPEGWEDLTFTTHLSDGSVANLLAGGGGLGSSPQAGGGGGGSELRVTRQNWRDYVRMVELARLKESSAMLAAFQDGLSAVLPTELLPLFTDAEVERLICGVREVDVDLLQQCTDYEDVSPDAPHVKAFWEVLHELRPEERTEFLRFTWARSRMPSSAKDFPMNFKIQGPAGGAKDQPDAYLPHAQTCFFSLSLPHYSSKEVLRKKLLLAIKNSPNMDADVRLHNAEGWSEA